MRHTNKGSGSLISGGSPVLDLSPDDLQKAGAFFLQIRSDLIAAKDEAELAQKIQGTLIRFCNPTAVFLAVSDSHHAGAYHFYVESKLELDAKNSVTDLLNKSLAMGFDSVSVELLDTLSFLNGVPRFLWKSPSEEKGRVLILLLGPEDLSSQLARCVLQELESILRIHIENGRMFEKISNSQREWENTFDSIADPMYIIDNDYKLKRMNKSLAGFAMKDIKLPENLNCYRHLFQRNTVCPWCPVPKTLQTGESVSVEAPIFSGGMWQMQSFPYTDKSDKRIGTIIILRDTTVLQSMQDQLIESEKMASTGKLISGVAHEVRNPLFGISATVTALANELGNKQEIKPFLDIITSETGRLNRLMEELLNYSRPVKIDKNPSNMGEIVHEVIEHFEHVPSAHNVSINFFKTEPIPAINVDRNKIKQVLFNLIENGIQHAREAPQIDLFLEYLSLANPPELHLVIKDNGEGISHDNLPRIFDPFFTTRQRGTGLGLSIVRKVIHDHGGRISVESHPGSGTIFRISLPLVQHTYEPKGPSN